ncbi:hypothetical protein KIPB_003680 [Kipferlia bialata]|uniref:Uncharacterized protein n=1 Tax=Kipferlia bialata TaxID=797122 RepID=A0A9K3CUF2_9EUKA|nr:hypothetical protein KIPB_003680 [Kipferlia bialata]|eukprot:g3680.t1
MKLILVIAALVALAACLPSEFQQFSIASVETSQTDGPSPTPAPIRSTVQGVDIDVLVNIGKAAWTIVNDNKSVFNYDSDSAYIVPEGITNWTQLEYWSPPVSVGYKAEWKNELGLHICDFEWALMYTYGGEYNDAGQYLSHVTIEPKHVNLDWGYSANVQVTIPADPVNLGSTESPIAGIEIRMVVDFTYLGFDEGSWTYHWFVQGDGAYQVL